MEEHCITVNMYMIKDKKTPKKRWLFSTYNSVGVGGVSIVHTQGVVREVVLEVGQVGEHGRLVSCLTARDGHLSRESIATKGIGFVPVGRIVLKVRVVVVTAAFQLERKIYMHVCYQFVMVRKKLIPYLGLN